jgi:hypothetical protein
MQTHINAHTHTHTHRHTRKQAMYMRAHAHNTHAGAGLNSPPEIGERLKFFFQGSGVTFNVYEM